MRHMVVIEKAKTNYAAYDLPGCVATGDTLAEVEQNPREAMNCHLEGMRIHGDPIPEPSARSLYVEIAA